MPTPELVEGYCGDGRVDASEACDDGSANSSYGPCLLDCTNLYVAPASLPQTTPKRPRAARCGNGAVEPGEVCDDGNTTSGDSCQDDCKLGCGDGTINGGESCDDGNTNAGDGCSSSCANEGRDFLLSARGPAKGKNIFGVELGIALVLPVGEVRYVRGLTDTLAFEGKLGVLVPVGQQLSLGLRYRLLELDDALSLALYSGLAAGKFFAQPDGDPSVRSLGGSAGLTMSMGGLRTQLSIAVEASYLSFRPTAPGSNSRQILVFLPTLNLEQHLRASKSSWILRVGALASGEEGARPIGVPMIAVGLSW